MKWRDHRDVFMVATNDVRLDTRTFKHLTEKKVYGDEVTIEKEDCINHVAKRGTALRKLATQTKKAGVTLGGPKGS